MLAEALKLVSFVMPVLDEARTLASSVESVLAQQLPAGYRAELIIALGPSQDDSSEIARALVAANPKAKITLVEVAQKSTPSWVVTA
jgi:glycosyltransferase involved in cell wall biosynthesis